MIQKKFDDSLRCDGHRSRPATGPWRMALGKKKSLNGFLSQKNALYASGAHCLV